MIRSRFTKAAGVATLGLMLSLAPTSSAQTGGGSGSGMGGSGSGTSSTLNNDTTRTDHRGFDWGWLGLLGLLGLAGMRRPHTNDGRDRHMGTAHA